MQELKRDGWKMVIIYNDHAIFAKDYNNGHFNCINSQGAKDPTLTVDKKDVTHLYYVAIYNA